MGPANQQHAITELRASPGELSFRAQVGGLDKRLFFRSDAELTPNADAALAACLMPAMRQGGTLRMEDPISPRLLRNQRDYQGTQRTWSLSQEFGEAPLRLVEVEAPTREAGGRAPTGRVAAFFSGGVDSYSTVLDNPDLTDLIFVRGVDLLPQVPEHAGLVDEVEARLGKAAVDMGLRLHVVETNVRELADPLVRWETYFACPLIAIGLFFEPLFDRVLIAGDLDYRSQDARGCNRLVPRLCSTENVEIAEDGGRLTRMQRTALVADSPVAQESLRVCWENPGGAYNCGRCIKCLMTLAALDALGARERFTSFPPALDLEALSAAEVYQDASLTLREDLLFTAVGQGARPELLAALDIAVERGRKRLGHPLGQRRLPEPPPAADTLPAAQEIADLRATPGELSFEARIGGESKRVWFRARTEADFVPPADAALAACLMPAMGQGGTLKMDDPVSPRILRNQREFGAIQQAWSPSWPDPYPRLREVEVQAPTRDPQPRSPTGRVAAFFSGGVDSFAAVLDNPDVTDLIFVRGIDLLPHLPQHQGLADPVEARVREAAAELGLPLHVVETNVRELADPLVRWETYFACPLIAIALFFEPLFDRVLISGDLDYAGQMHLHYGAIWNVIRLWSSERLEIVDWGGEHNRDDRLRLIAGNPVAQKHLRVCWENRGGAYNCGRCGKCMRSMSTLEALGVRERFVSFPADFAPERILENPIAHQLELIVAEDSLRTARATGRPDLAQPLETLLARGRETLGLDPDFRIRDAGPGAVAGGHGQRLLADRETAAALASAGAAALLVGSFDGSGNFGDIAQLEGALRVLAPLDAELLALPVVELGARERRRSREDGPRGLGPVLYFDPEGVGAPDLDPVEPPHSLAFGACYLYGGGYLNAAWGERKLAMVGAAEALLGAATGEQPCRLSSGLQVDAAWLARLPVADRRALARFEPLGARDPASAGALACLDPEAPVLESGDDAIGVLPRPPAGSDRSWSDPEALLLVNVHCSRHAWVTDSPEAVPRFQAEVLAALAERSGRAVRARPLVAYLDPHADERRDCEALSAACAERGIELEPPLHLRTASVEAEAATLGAAALTLTCSYHAALASLLLGVPAVLLADTAYYAQKAAGLEQAFALPPELRAKSAQSPQELAERIAAALLDPKRGAELRTGIRVRGEQLRTRRAGAESALMGRLASAAFAGPGKRLSVLLDSRSWRLTAPLRDAKAVARQRIQALRAGRARR
jgi:hypothetical protein